MLPFLLKKKQAQRDLIMYVRSHRWLAACQHSLLVCLPKHVFLCRGSSSAQEQNVPFFYTFESFALFLKLSEVISIFSCTSR